MTREYKLAQHAAKAALQYRKRIGLGFDTPCDIYEIIASEKLDLQFIDVPTLEGMFLHEPETTRVCVCAHRPWGRQRFTAAHELGHYFFGHGSQVDIRLEWLRTEAVADEEI